MNFIKVGLIGIGTVGSGTFKILKRNQEEIIRRIGYGIKITMVADLNVAQARKLTNEEILVVNDANLVVSNPEIDIVIELIGGCTIAKELVFKAIANGKHVVTANKALIATYGNEIFRAAEKKDIIVAFEAAVAGGIPIIKTLREGLTANRIQWIIGIINGTTNFILSEMRNTGLDFAIALKKAQQLGYAEADPSFDIKGIDAAHKLCIMASIAFGIPMQLNKVYIEGITNLQTLDIQYAEQLDYRIKLLSITKLTSRGIELRVHPTLVPSRFLVANVEGVMNAVMIYSDAVGETLYYGQGAGSEPTASAVIADLIDIVRFSTLNSKYRIPHLSFQPNTILNKLIIRIQDIITNYYLRIRTIDTLSVFSEISCILANLSISISTMFQKKLCDTKSNVDIIILTARTTEHNIETAITNIKNLPIIIDQIIKIRLETFN